MQPIYNPPIPYLGAIPGGLCPGRMIRIQGTIPPHAQRFAVNIQCGPGVNPRDDIALHLNVRFAEQCIVRNHLQGQSWGLEQCGGGMPLGPGQPVQLLILCQDQDYKVAVNGSHFCEFPHRLPYQRANHITIDGDVTVSMITFEGGEVQQGYQPQAPPPAYSAAPPPMQGPPAYGAPPPYPQQPGYNQQATAMSYAPPPGMAGYQQGPMGGPMGGPPMGGMPGMMGGQPGMMGQYQY